MEDLTLLGGRLGLRQKKWAFLIRISRETQKWGGVHTPCTWLYLLMLSLKKIQQNETLQ